ncbi:hypothetical protein SLEP1_g52061 [Rubroshorea leprosula]|uniref:Uncharacterized protein n=1 Tax=Rubroshorea leprosula TaxID=152421 RepID=A0AAV5M7R9_9ROSI|nr:hypothetical protein SLEP1_g52061 [Rubroshorea leprosula]
MFSKFSISKLLAIDTCLRAKLRRTTAAKEKELSNCESISQF